MSRSAQERAYRIQITKQAKEQARLAAETVAQQSKAQIEYHQQHVRLFIIIFTILIHMY